MRKRPIVLGVLALVVYILVLVGLASLLVLSVKNFLNNGGPEAVGEVIGRVKKGIDQGENN